MARVSGISKSVMKQCSRHLSDCGSRSDSGEPAQAHFRAVCRALVSEATELSTFLTIPSSPTLLPSFRVTMRRPWEGRKEARGRTSSLSVSLMSRLASHTISRS